MNASGRIARHRGVQPTVGASSHTNAASATRGEVVAQHAIHQADFPAVIEDGAAAARPARRPWTEVSDVSSIGPDRTPVGDGQIDQANRAPGLTSKSLVMF